MAEINDRIREIVEATCGGNKTRFSSFLSVSEGTVRHIASDTDPKGYLLSMICRQFGVSGDWLLTGRGDMFKDATKNAIYIQKATNHSQIATDHSSIGMPEPEHLQEELEECQKKCKDYEAQLEQERIQNRKLQDALIALAGKL